jgi:hypothetical protein
VMTDQNARSGIKVTLPKGSAQDVAAKAKVMRVAVDPGHDGPRVLRRVPTGLSAPAIRGGTAGRHPPPPPPRPGPGSEPRARTERQCDTRTEIENRESGPARS